MSSGGSDAEHSSTLNRTVCTLCRQRKTKCSRELPKCNFCVKAKAACQYLDPPKKRGLRAGYVSELESRIESLESEVESLRNASPATPAPNTTGLVQSSPRTPTVVNSNCVREREPASRSFYDRSSPSNAAVTDMMSLPRSYYYALAESWFKEEHTWEPFLHYEHVQSSLSDLPDPVDHIKDVVLRAIIALKLAYSSQAICLGYVGRRRLSSYLRSEVLLDAMANPSVKSIQALFIIAVLDYGSDNIPSTFNIMSMCRRTGEHIGIFRQLLQRIESQPPSNVGPPTKDVFASSHASVALTWAVLAFDAVSSLGVSWRDVSAALVDHLAGVAYVSVPDFRDSFTTHVHLAAIGVQPVHEFLFRYAQGEHQTLTNDTSNTIENIYQNLMSYVHGLPSSGYTILADGAVDFDINHIFTRLLSHAVVIMIYERYCFDDAGLEQTPLARDRCLRSYDQVIDVVRNISDADAEINTPTFAHFISIAARFKLVLVRHLGEVRDPLFDILMHGINMCGRRWPLARRIDIALRAAIVEIDTGVSSGLPDAFWDLKQSGLDISESVKTWVHEYKPNLYVGSLNGPYV